MRSRGSGSSSASDAALVALTRAANHSRLWMALAAVLALAGGRRGRRAAARGLAAIALASAASNGPLKLVFRHQRPTRRPALVRRPGTYSFPSGHSASAFAFATAASAEFPAVAPVLLPLASAVAYSRVHVGVHRWKDVLAGGAVGVACGAVADTAVRWLRRPRQAPPDRSPARLPGEVVLVTSRHAGGGAGLTAWREPGACSASCRSAPRTTSPGRWASPSTRDGRPHCSPRARSPTSTSGAS